MTLKINLKNNHFILHPTGTIFWEEKKMLLISDVHLGKVSHFRKHGMAIPGNAISKNFEQLNTALDFFNPSIVVFLGDLFHSKINNEWGLFEDWVSGIAAEIILVAGNHDILDERHFEKIGIKIFSEIETDGFLFTHHPDERDNLFNFCGHIHPGIKIYGIGKQSLKLPCFFQKENQMILPAFGEFTGNYFLVPAETDIVYAVTKDEVIVVAKN
ncbi:ligase-associated DNA damage response endonuclease PdeM [Flavobacterium sp. 3HN19-14]|uniref:ligase-associated DNA damage response endonuclease PdeM n=1 Tax=Flavobacterium sp. 3HN19-14 TaxID=3448133 RepID=UPI003EDFBF4A